jgi:tRNA pseudouridine55 synthase
VSTLSGVALLDKPAGITSHEALACVKKAAGTRRVGHTGTLDRFATGLLVALVGEYTPLASLFEGLPKTYIARLELGAETDTLDPEGNVVKTGPVPTDQTIRSVLPGFLGTQSQVPPAFSAVHVEGKRAYREARAGRQPALRPRTVTIHELTILECAPPLLDLRIRCSRGTYVRSLARDLGRQAGSCAHVVDLRRVAVGDIGVQEAVTPADFDPDRHLIRGAEFFRRHEVAALLALDTGRAEALRHGRAVRAGGPETTEYTAAVLCVDPEGAPIAVVRWEAGMVRPVRVLGR